MKREEKKERKKLDPFFIVTVLRSPFRFWLNVRKYILTLFFLYRSFMCCHPLHTHSNFITWMIIDLHNFLSFTYTSSNLYSQNSPCYVHGIESPLFLPYSVCQEEVFFILCETYSRVDASLNTTIYNPFQLRVSLSILLIRIIFTSHLFSCSYTFIQ